ncbi:YdbL family protein [Zooshikella marina]|uniref:YdbL family protein n=1 Tax=Zooshikella ganghwensis TaxID=202772 RepID=UPI001BAF50F4|nr:YdbL family protein [Zooshikella ganghwensis]MBU2707008.1 YdbL family protein [Zooshikella ganghwensis]
MKIVRGFRLLVLGLILCLPLTVLAMSLEEAKQQGLVGEQLNGYLGLVVNNVTAKKLITGINQKRKQKYEQLAKRNGVPLATISSLAGQKAIEKTPNGQYVQNSSGQWVKK